MFKTNRYYLAISVGAKVDDSSQWFPVFCEDAEKDIWRKIGSTRSYKLRDFQQVMANDIIATYKTAKNLRGLFGEKPRVTVQFDSDNEYVTRLLQILHELKEDFEGYAQLTDSDRQQKVMQTYSLVGKIKRE
jgi:hypothetical protein